MAFLVVALVLLAGLCCLLLVLVLAVLRRLREHETRFERLSAGAVDEFAYYDGAELVGRRVPGFAGHPDAAPRLVGFFSVGCGTCHEQAPPFIASASERDASAIVLGSPADEMTGLLEGVPRLIVGEEGDTLAKAVGIKVFPTFVEVDGDGVIVRAAVDMAELPAAAPAL
ncbi:TlpA family protein disulfide reductase [Streptomyces uncialis]|uniref:TlpA family protein disulfide reductase n=1 Tax=Streptomyces uncialis TaxID=1048205 RepID=UPI0036558A89